jgi:hypothetical protein
VLVGVNRIVTWQEFPGFKVGGHELFIPLNGTVKPLKLIALATPPPVFRMVRV